MKKPVRCHFVKVPMVVAKIEGCRGATYTYTQCCDDFTSIDNGRNPIL